MIRLIPREEKYFTLLSELARKVREGGDVFVKLIQDFNNRIKYAEEIKGMENECDDLVSGIKKKLDSSFITPIDREDIHLLINELDDVIDMINDLARSMDIYGISSLRSDACEVAGLLSRATVELEGAFELLESQRGLGEHCNTIKQLEKRADSLYSDSIRRLFIEEKEPIEVLKWMKIYEELERSIDRCKDVAEALEAVVVKNK